MHQVIVQPADLESVEQYLLPPRWRLLQEMAEAARHSFGSRVLWNINATAQGGGVAEMLRPLLAFTRGAGVDARWLVLDGDPEFFAITKRIHNLLHGSEGDGKPLGEPERQVYDDLLGQNLRDFGADVTPGDIVVLHDPQTAGLIPALRKLGAHTVWRCHVGRDEQNALTDIAWSFLRPYVEQAEAFVFSREQYAPRWIRRDRLCVIPPSIDPMTPKNLPLDEETVQRALLASGLILSTADGVGPVRFSRQDGSPGEIRSHPNLYRAGAAPALEAPVVVQVSRWDHLKDMGGVLAGFAAALDKLPHDVHLLLVGPEVSGVTDDPEGAEVLAECVEQLCGLPAAIRDRIGIVCLPMDDVDENAFLVNALQQHASVIVQKSLAEGFGITVTEAMWKEKPVVASAVGGIQDQIHDGGDGILLNDPRDLQQFGSDLATLLHDPDLSARIGRAAKLRVQDEFLVDRHLIQYAELLGSLVESDGG